MSWLGRLFDRKRMESDLEKELRFHFETQVAEKMQLGAPESEARRLTRLELGGIEQIKEDCRKSRGTLWLEYLVQDIRFLTMEYLDGVALAGKVQEAGPIPWREAQASLTTYLVAGAANERAACLKETQRPAHLTRDADAHSCANVRSLSNRSPKPKRTIGTQVNSVQALVDFQCSRKPPRTSRQICEFVGLAEPLH